MRTARILRIARLGAALALLGFGVQGCGSKADYPSNLAFPSRTDLLVLKSPEVQPDKGNDPGKIEEDLAALESKGGKTADPRALPDRTRAAIDQYLREAFGTPAAPTIPAGESAPHLDLSAERLTEGGKLFRRHCQQCHNLGGDGRGPGGLWVMPYPRDYRRGQFKFTSTGGTGKPRRADLMRTLTDGLKGTAMPAFGLLAENERSLLAGYVTYLAIRGEVEYQTYAAAHASAAPDVPAYAAERVKAVLAEWEKAEAAPALPPAPDDGEPGSESHFAAVKRGYELFTRNTDNSCIKCHGEFGRKPVLRYDVWGTVARPADLTATTLKGGTLPQDIFARIRGGIPAVGMPAHADLTDRQVWDLVRFVKSAPYQRELPPEVRKAIYPDSGGAP